MFSMTVRLGYRLKLWVKYAVSDRISRAGRPKTSATPELASITPANIWNVVVLPAPSGPMSPKISPRSTLRSIPRTASVAPYFFVSLTVPIANEDAASVGSFTADGELATLIRLTSLLAIYCPAPELRHRTACPVSHSQFRIRAVASHPPPVSLDRPGNKYFRA